MYFALSESDCEGSTVTLLMLVPKVWSSLSLARLESGYCRAMSSESPSSSPEYSTRRMDRPAMLIPKAILAENLNESWTSMVVAMAICLDPEPFFPLVLNASCLKS